MEAQGIVEKVAMDLSEPSEEEAIIVALRAKEFFGGTIHDHLMDRYREALSALNEQEKR